MQIKIAFQLGLDRLDVDVAGGRMVNHCGRYATRQGMQWVFDWVWGLVITQQDGGLHLIEDEWLGSGRVFLAGSIEALNRRTIEAAVLPGVLRADMTDLVPLRGLTQIARWLGGEIKHIQSCLNDEILRS